MRFPSSLLTPLAPLAQLAPLALLVGCTTPAPISDDDDAALDDDDAALDDDDATPECESYGLEPGDCPPEFELPSTSGGQVSLGDFQGERVIVLGTSNW